MNPKNVAQASSLQTKARCSGRYNIFAIVIVFPE
jgi:hypothetical protein